MRKNPELPALRSKGPKRTAQREAILKVLRATTKPLMASEVLQRVRKLQPKVSQDTVYRNLRSLVVSGELAQTHLQNKSASRFEYQAEGSHHHHAICLSCDRSFCLAQVPEPITMKLEEDPGFQVLGHTLEFYGYCSVCQKARRS